MFLITHAALGAIGAEYLTNNPWVAFTLGSASHFLVDIIPHGDTQMYKGYISGKKVRRALSYVGLDAMATIIFILVLFNLMPTQRHAIMSWGILGGVLPDLLVAMYEVFHFKLLRWFHRFHFFFHNLVSSRKGDLPFFQGFVMQVFFFALLVVKIVGKK